MSGQPGGDGADFVAYTVGLCHASVCTSLGDDEATRQLNLEHPTGVGDWQPSPNPTFRTGEPNPTACEKRPATHRHILYEC